MSQGRKVTVKEAGSVETDIAPDENFEMQKKTQSSLKRKSQLL